METHATPRGTFRIRPVTEVDLPQLLGFLRELAEHEKVLHRVTATEELLGESFLGASPRAEAVFGHLGGQPAAFAVFYLSFSSYRGRPGLHLEDLYVRPEHRGGGLGRILLSYVARAAQQRGCDLMEWSSLAWNEAAKRFYLRLGATAEDRCMFRLSGGPLDALADGKEQGDPMAGSETKFVGTIPQKYETHLGPLLFEPCAADFVRRIHLPPGCRVLELACGTGILTRRILETLPDDGLLTATDLNESMLELGRSRVGTDRRLEWRAANAMTLPFEDATFDRVVCQFGVMFFPDKLVAFREAHRVLRPRGEFAFSTWDSLDENLYAKITDQGVARYFPADPPKFLHIPYGYFDREILRTVLNQADFDRVRVEKIALESSSPTARNAAVGLVEGTPMSAAIQERGVSDPSPIVDAVASALAASLGEAPMRCSLRALWVRGEKA